MANKDNHVVIIGPGAEDYDIENDTLIKFMNAHPAFFEENPYSDIPETEKEKQLDENCKNHGRYWHRMEEGKYHVCDCDGCVDQVYPSIDIALEEDSYYWFF